MKEIVCYAEVVIRDQYECYVSSEDDNLWTIEEWAVNEATYDPGFYRWLFDDDTVGDFGSNLSDEEREIASTFFKSL